MLFHISENLLPERLTLRACYPYNEHILLTYTTVTYVHNFNRNNNNNINIKYVNNNNARVSYITHIFTST